MNAKQKAARLIGMTFIAVAALFPPWQATVKKDGKTEVSSLGYHPLWNPPSTEVQIEGAEVQAESGSVEAHYRINLIQLGIQLGIVLLAVNGAVYLLKEKRQLPFGG